MTYRLLRRETAGELGRKRHAILIEAIASEGASESDGGPEVEGHEEAEEGGQG